MLEIVALYNSLRIRHRDMAGTDTHCFSAIRTERRAIAEIVAVDMVMVLLRERVVWPYDESGALIGFARKIAVSHHIVLSPETYPIALLGFIFQFKTRRRY